MSKRKSFLIYIDSLPVLDDLTDEQAGKLFKAISSYHKGEDLELDSLTKIAFSPFKSQFIRDDEKYQKIVERNKNNGLKGGRPKTEDNPEKPSGLNGNPENPNKADSDSDSDSDSDIKHIDQSKIAREELIQSSFDYWWKAYPTKTARKASLKKWQSITKKMDDNIVTELTNHIVADVKFRLDGLANGDDRFIGFDRLHPSTYLNQERYNDDF